MSAFIVSPRTMKLAVAGMSKATDTEEDIRDLGHQLCRMNARAVNARYGEDYEGDRFFFDPLVHDNATPIQKLKAMQCLKYQCSEGHVPEEQLYKRLEERIIDLTDEIVCSLPEYDQTPWDHR